MAGTVYIETSIPSAYVDERQDLISQTQRFCTRQWWDVHRTTHSLGISEAVIAELTQAAFPGQSEAIALMQEVPVFRLTDRIVEVAEYYMAHLLMPRERFGDGFHLAFASVYGFDYLLTWNCKHLANPRKTGHIAEINRRLGLNPPIILTPQMLLEDLENEPT